MIGRCLSYSIASSRELLLVPLLCLVKPVILVIFHGIATGVACLATHDLFLSLFSHASGTDIGDSVGRTLMK